MVDIFIIVKGKFNWVWILVCLWNIKLIEYEFSLVVGYFFVFLPISYNQSEWLFEMKRQLNKE